MIILCHVLAHVQTLIKTSVVQKIKNDGFGKSTKTKTLTGLIANFRDLSRGEIADPCVSDCGSFSCCKSFTKATNCAARKKIFYERQLQDTKQNLMGRTANEVLLRENTVLPSCPILEIPEFRAFLS